MDQEINQVSFKLALKQNWIVIAVICVVVILLWWPSRYQPYHWDSAGFVIPYAHHLLTHNFSLPTDANLDYGHPPLFMYLIASSWSLFGQSLPIAHLLMIPFGILYLVASYKIAKTIFNRSWAIILLLWLISLPIFVAQLRKVYLDLPVAAVGLSFILAVLHKRWPLASALLSLAFLIKLNALGFIPFFAIALLYDQPRQIGKLKWLLPPIGTLLLWLVLHHHQYGYFLFQPGYSYLTPPTWSFGNLLTSFGNQLSQLFLPQYRWLIFGCTSLGIWSYINSQSSNHASPKTKQNLLLISTALGVNLLFLAASGHVHTRYLMGVIPLYYLLGIWGLQQVINTKIPRAIPIIIAAILSFIVLSLSQWHTRQPNRNQKTYYVAQEMNLNFEDMRQNWINAAQYLEYTFPSARIYGSFPESYTLTQPYQGYVSQPLNFQTCHSFDTISLDAPTIIYRHRYTPSQGQCQNILDNHSHKLIKRFETNGWWVELYQLIQE